MSPSRVWNYFTRSTDKSKATCNLCYQDFVFKNTTSNLLNHLNGEPPSKKRRTDDFDDDEDDGLWDDEDFTAAELDDINDQEIRASQACTTKPSVSQSFVTEQRESLDTFLKPRLSRSSSSTGSHSNSGSSRQSRTSSVLSVIGNNSVPRLNASDSSYPSSLSGYSGASSCSIRSGDPGGVLRRASFPSNGSGSDSDHTSLTAKEEVDKMQQECASLKEKVTKLSEELCVKDGRTNS